MSAPRPRPDAITVPDHAIRRRSVGFLEREGDRWACFLVTFPDGDGGWRGHLAFRPSEGQEGGEGVSTGDIFVEKGEGEIHQKARSLGRPLLSALLDSALHIRERERKGSPFLQRWFQEVLAGQARGGEGPPDDGGGEVGDGGASGDYAELQSLYASYRMDQVAHLIALVHPDDFQRAVERVLDGQRIDFAARDRLQMAMLVVERIESLLPLPPFEVWVADFVAHRDEYARYAHLLHREGVLP